MSSIIKVGKLQSSTGQDAVTVADSGAITANGALTASGGIANAGTISAGTIGNSVTMPSGSYELITSSLDTNTSTNQPQVDFHNCFSSTYESYFIDLQMVISDNESEFRVYLSTGGSSYVNAGANHDSTMEQMYTGNTTHAHFAGGQNQTFWDWGYSSWGTSHSSDAYERPFKVRIFVDFPYDNTKDTYGQAELLFPHSGDGNLLVNKGGGNLDTNVSVTGIRFAMSGGDIKTHNIKVYGIRA